MPPTEVLKMNLFWYERSVVTMELENKREKKWWQKLLTEFLKAAFGGG